MKLAKQVLTACNEELMSVEEFRKLSLENYNTWGQYVEETMDDAEVEEALRKEGVQGTIEGLMTYYEHEQEQEAAYRNCTPRGLDYS